MVPFIPTPLLEEGVRCTFVSYCPNFWDTKVLIVSVKLILTVLLVSFAFFSFLLGPGVFPFP